MPTVAQPPTITDLTISKHVSTLTAGHILPTNAKDSFKQNLKKNNPYILIHAKRAVQNELPFYRYESAITL